MANRTRLSTEALTQLRKRVDAYYRAHGRHDLPWRRTRNPYHILVSEFMLQQTQVTRVVGYYRTFLETFPTIEVLAAAPLREVLRVWSGLGYNRRARALRDTARVIVEEYQGRIPADTKALEALPGIGSYTAAAIAVFAYGKRHVLLETNVRSVFLHEWFPREHAVPDEDLCVVAEAALGRRNARTWHWALMDYGVHLKHAHKNPSRRSKHYTRQSRFEGSLRQARGRILKELATRSAREKTLLRRTDLSPQRLNAALIALERDGFVIHRRGVWKLGA